MTVKGPKKILKIILLGFSLGGKTSAETVAAEENKLGIFTVTLPKNSDTVMYEPRQRNVLVSGVSDDDDSRTYFQLFHLTRGQLKPSCCTTDDITLTCPGSTQDLSLLSSCQWSTNMGGVTRTVGTVFVEGRYLSLPTSISGLSYRGSTGKDYRYDIRATDSQCMACNECEDDSDGQCYCYSHTTRDTQDFLNARALGLTYITEIQKLLPSWLKMSVNLKYSLETSPLTKNDMLAKITRPNEQVSSLEGCNQLTSLANSFFSVLRYDKTLSANISGELHVYKENSGTGTGGDIMCFAVDLCHESESPVHIQISQAINNVLVSHLQHRFTNRHWNFHFHTASLFKRTIPHYNYEKYWNGTAMIQFPVVDIDLSLKTDVVLRFTDESPNMTLKFSGDAALNYMVSKPLISHSVSYLV